MDEYCENLMNTIIIKAVDDYRKAARKLITQPDNPDAQIEISDITAFFRSKWFRFLSTIDPEKLICRLEAETRKDNCD